MPLKIILTDDDLQEFRHLLADKPWSDVPRFELLDILASVLEYMNRGAFRAEFEERLPPPKSTSFPPYIHSPAPADACPLCALPGHRDVECELW